MVVVIFGKTHGDAGWTLIYAATVHVWDPTGRWAARQSMADEIQDRAERMDMPTVKDAAAAHRRKIWPCATMCTLYHRRELGPERPRLIVFQDSDKWMVYDKYGYTVGPRQFHECIHFECALVDWFGSSKTCSGSKEGLERCP